LTRRAGGRGKGFKGTLALRRRKQHRGRVSARGHGRENLGGKKKERIDWGIELRSVVVRAIKKEGHRGDNITGGSNKIPPMEKKERKEGLQGG